jgi:hypothetical protein
VQRDIDPSERVLSGRPAIEKDFADLFAQNKGLKLRIEVASLKFPHPGDGRGGWDHGSPRVRWHGPSKRRACDGTAGCGLSRARGWMSPTL